jgi:hypothetical protein
MVALPGRLRRLDDEAEAYIARKQGETACALLRLREVRDSTSVV